MGIYRPTFLYIKQHKITGLLYFGKTIRSPIEYSGSGIYWLRHLEKYGIEHVETLWYCLFTDKETLVEFALNFSRQQDIVNSKDWANLVLENGIQGGNTREGAIISESHKLKQSTAMRGRKITDDHKANISKAQLGKIRGPNKKLTVYPLRVCPHCGKSGAGPSMTNWHFDRCRS